VFIHEVVLERVTESIYSLEGGGVPGGGEKQEHREKVTVKVKQGDY
jgi:hypothetical protein